MNTPQDQPQGSGASNTEPTITQATLPATLASADAFIPEAPHPNSMAERLAMKSQFTRPEVESYALEWANEQITPERLQRQAELALKNTEQAETIARLAVVRRYLKYMDQMMPGGGPGIRWPWHIRLTVGAVLLVTAVGLAFELRNIAVQLMGTLPGVASIASGVLYGAAVIAGSFAIKAVYEQLAPWWRRWVLITAAIAWGALFITWGVASAGSFAQFAANPMDSLGGALDGDGGDASLDAGLDGDAAPDEGATATSRHPMIMMTCMFLLAPLTALLGMSFFSHVARLYGPKEVPNKRYNDYRAEESDLVNRRSEIVQATAPLVARITKLQGAPERIVREALEVYDGIRESRRKTPLALPAPTTQQI